ncbi:MAG TPA: fluoride efflux transporter CrcB [Thermopetrobacter sp.]|nr:fluoride efflux transporter CrcB [Thermopetrobacter sp.]
MTFSLSMVAAVAAGGALGAAARFATTTLAVRLFGHGFPWGTMIVNTAGSFLIGLMIAVMALKWQVGEQVRAFLVTGILGGFTTFSAFALDVATLYERKAVLAAFSYVAGSVGLSLIAIFAGLALGRLLFSP